MAVFHYNNKENLCLRKKLFAWIGVQKERRCFCPRGTYLIKLVLWLCFLLPGIFYSIWRHTIRENVCRCCGGNTLVPPDSPRGKNYPRDKDDLSRKLTAIYPQEPSAHDSGHCRKTERAKPTSDFPQSIKLPPTGFSPPFPHYIRAYYYWTFPCPVYPPGHRHWRIKNK